MPVALALDLLDADRSAAASTPAAASAAPSLSVESWSEFHSLAGARVPMLVRDLWPEQSEGFIGGPPKSGKTWLGLALALSVATGRPFLGRFDVPQARPVLYVALEGARAALRDRVGCLGRGLGLDPDPKGEALARFHITYKPRGINLAEPAWALALLERACACEAALVVVDVLRRAAIYRENVAEDWLALVHNLEPLAEHGASVALLHHYGKLTELQGERAPAERMSGTGAMFGTLDAGIFITASRERGRLLRVEFEARDLAAPEPVGLALEGEGSGPNGSFLETDTASFVVRADVPAEARLKAPPSEIAAFVRESGGEVSPQEIRDRFGIADATLRARRGELAKLGIAHERGRYFDATGPPPTGAEPAPAETANRGCESDSAWLSENKPAYAEPAIRPPRVEKSADLQAKRETAEPHPLRGSLRPSRVAAPTTSADAAQTSLIRDDGLRDYAEAELERIRAKFGEQDEGLLDR
jgi:hypothetical protein